MVTTPSGKRYLVAEPQRSEDAGCHSSECGANTSKRDAETNSHKSREMGIGFDKVENWASYESTLYGGLGGEKPMETGKRWCFAGKMARLTLGLTDWGTWGWADGDFPALHRHLDFPVVMRCVAVARSG